MKRSDYQKALSVQEVKETVLRALLSFRDICEKEGLRYYLAFGTLLGAVRHKGFIPWDDDVDILMPRSDYERLREMAPKIRTNDYELLHYSHEPNYFQYFMKYCDRRTIVTPPRFNNGYLYGLNIDIFPLDYFDGPDGESVHQEMISMKKAIKKLEDKYWIWGTYQTGPKAVVKKMIKKALYLLHKKKADSISSVYAEADLKLRKRANAEGPYAAYMYDRQNALWLKKDFTGGNDETSDLLFEGFHFTGPADPDTVLTKLFGDYMTPPPPEKQVSLHSYTAFLLNPEIRLHKE